MPVPEQLGPQVPPPVKDLAKEEPPGRSQSQVGTLLPVATHHDFAQVTWPEGQPAHCGTGSLMHHRVAGFKHNSGYTLSSRAIGLEAPRGYPLWAISLSPPWALPKLCVPTGPRAMRTVCQVMPNNHENRCGG